MQGKFYYDKRILGYQDFEIAIRLFASKPSEVALAYLISLCKYHPLLSRSASVDAGS